MKKGDQLLAPRLPDRGQVAIIEALKIGIWGYHFKNDNEKQDYGLIFPARCIKSFFRTNENVSSGIRATLKNVSRFWSIQRYAADVRKLLEVKVSG